MLEDEQHAHESSLPLWSQLVSSICDLRKNETLFDQYLKSSEREHDRFIQIWWMRIEKINNRERRRKSGNVHQERVSTISYRDRVERASREDQELQKQAKKPR